MDLMDSNELEAAQQLAREAGHWRDDELGMFRLSAAFTPEVGAPIMKRWDDETDRLYRRRNKVSSQLGAAAPPTRLPVS